MTDLIQPEWQDTLTLMTPILVDGEKTETITLNKPKRKHIVAAQKGKTPDDQDNLLVQAVTNLSLNEVMELDQLDFEEVLRLVGPFISRSLWKKPE